MTHFISANCQNCNQFTASPFVVQNADASVKVSVCERCYNAYQELRSADLSEVN